MKKSIQLLGLLFISSISFSQTITSVTRVDDIYCNNETIVYTIDVDNPTLEGISIVVENGISSFGYLNLYVDQFTEINGFTYTYTLTSNAFLSTSVFELDTFNIQLMDEVGSVVDNEEIGCKVYGDIDPTLTNASIEFCSNAQPFDLFEAIMPTDLNGDFIWANQESSILVPTEYYEFDGTQGISYRITNSEGCVGTSQVEVLVIQPPSLIVNAINTTCGSAVGSASIDAIGQSSSYYVYWSTGASESFVSSSFISNLSSGTYYANVTDDFNCSVVEEIHISDSDIIVTDAITAQTCNLNNGEIELTVTPPTGATFTSFWSNGNTNQNMINSLAGEYSVEIHTSNNCNFFATYEIPNNNINFSLEPGYPYAGDCGAESSGGANIIVSGGSGNFSYDWYNSTTSSAVGTTQNLTGAVPGVYECTVTDTDNSCSESWNVVIPAVTDAVVNVISVTKEDCGQSNGAVDVSEALFGSPMVSSWLWSNGATTEDLIDVPAGDYTLEFTIVDGCKSYLEVTVPNTRPYQPQICLLSVDTSNTYNMIIWEKDPFNVVDGWNVYRETTVYGQFELVTSIPYAEDAMFIDNSASPTARSWRYYITSFDNCGESYGSFIHKTIHTVSFDDGTGSGALKVVWDDYEGINYSSIDLLKHTDALGWQLLTTVTTGNEYLDTDAPNDMVGINYMVEFNLSSPCNPGKAIDHNSSRSNKSSSIFQPGGETGLSIIENEEGEIVMYPNPTSNDLTIYIENSDKFEYFNIIDINGKLIHSQSINSDFNFVSMLDFEQGIYFVQIYSQTDVSIEKIIKQ